MEKDGEIRSRVIAESYYCPKMKLCNEELQAAPDFITALEVGVSLIDCMYQGLGAHVPGSPIYKKAELKFGSFFSDHFRFGKKTRFIQNKLFFHWRVFDEPINRCTELNVCIEDRNRYPPLVGLNFLKVVANTTEMSKIGEFLFTQFRAAEPKIDENLQGMRTYYAYIL